MRILKYLTLLILITLVTSLAHGDVSTSPSSVNVARGQSTSITITYSFSGVAVDGVFTSPTGYFLPDLGTNPVPLSVTIVKGSGRVSETLTIPLSVVERAFRQGMGRFTYQRTFILQKEEKVSETAMVNIRITPETIAEFSLRRVELYFDGKDRRPEAIVNRNFKGLKAHTDIYFNGSGFLQGYWEVDGRVIENISRHVTFGAKVTLSTPDIPGLPTFEPGFHIVRFVITNPQPPFELPQIVYWVTAREEPVKRIISLITPKDGAAILPEDEFRWDKTEGISVYLITFIKADDETIVFSALTRESSYKIPQSVFSGFFSKDMKYLWKVKGFDAENNIIGESVVWSFSFKRLDAYVPGQIIIALAETVFSEDILSEIKDRHKLKVIDAFSLKSVNLSVALFETTEKDIFRVIDELKKDRRILIVQPNYILRTMSDPLRKMQYASDILKLDKIHDVYKGRGIKVAVLDTGVDTNHDDLKERVVFSRNHVRGEGYLAEVHGTAIAGIIGASINGFGIEGVAPEAEIVALRACRQVSKERPEGECFTDSLSKAMDEAILQKVNIVNMSFGTTQQDKLLKRLIDKGVEQGILFVASAGNFKAERGLRFPASYPSVISVGGFDERLNPYPNPDITKKTSVCAPAVNIITTVPDNKHNFLSGTSMSSAYISGILALALEKDKSINKQRLPVYKGDICKWQEELLEISICGR